VMQQKVTFAAVGTDRAKSQQQHWRRQITETIV